MRGSSPRDPCEAAPVGSYLTDGTRLVEIVEVDHAGAIGEDQSSYQWLELSPEQIEDEWRPVLPEKDAA